MREAPRVAVLEACNETLKESYLFITGTELHAIMRNQCEHPPAPIAHWQKGQDIRYREIEGDLDAAGARSFLKKYAEVIARSGWTILAD